ncbi:unnamed protein product [Ilex paraguariensis]|uniref:AAA+ ATPase domain-containing protein n=1 Tax=Ilex paraguariensis TaxID=185542 RepID=A0ABC8TI90_9AQUA
MEVVAAAVGSLLAEPARRLCGYIYSKVRNPSNLQSNFTALEEEVRALMSQKEDMEEELEAAELEGKVPKADVEKWLRMVDDVNSEVNSLQPTMAASGNGRCFNCYPHNELNSKVVETLEQVRELIKAGDFLKRVAVGNYLPKPVEHIPAPRIENQTGYQNLVKIMDALSNNKQNRIGIWGMGGVGKTTLVKNLNNKLQSSSSTQPFSIVIWTTVSMELNWRKVQTQIAERLNLQVKMGESVERMAIRLHKRLAKEKNFLLILDDVWEAIDLDLLGIPRPEADTGSKIILTSRSLDVCRVMMTDVNIQVDVLNDREAWQLFHLNTGDVAMSEQIKPFAEAVAKECGGLPLALIVVGASMRGKTMVALWKDALNALRRSVPLVKGIEEKVYKPLKWSYDSLQGEHLKSCFLFCCLYSEDFPMEVCELVRYWFAEGLLDQRYNYEELENRGVAIIESLIDSCLLERGVKGGTVKMHDVVRDVGIWIASALEDGYKSLIQSGIGLSQIPKNELSNCPRRVSFMNNRIESLPDCVIQCPRASTLLLQGNHCLEEVPDQFLQGFQALKILDLSESSIYSLPRSLLQLGELRALLLRGCKVLHKLPPLGGLSRLQVLDCSRSGIRALPEGMEKLTDLRQLDLSYTHNLTILAGTISRLSNLEFLNVLGRSFNLRRNDEASFTDLLCLKQLNVLYIEFDSIPIINPKDISWLKTISKVNTFIGNRARDRMPENAVDYNEGCVILNNLCFSGEWIGWLLIGAASVQIFCCEGMNRVLEKLAKNSGSSGCFAALRSLHITFCHSSFQSATRGCAAQFDLLPNLEELRLHSLSRLESISEFGDNLGSKFCRLRRIDVFSCPQLKYLLCIGSSILTLEKLEEIRIESCEKLKELFNYVGSTHTLAPDPTVPNLQVMKLKDLPDLEILCRQNESWGGLELLESLHCNIIRKLPLSTQNADTIKEIRGELQWWNQLEWDDDDTKLSLQRHFRAVDNYGHLIC